LIFSRYSEIKTMRETTARDPGVRSLAGADDLTVSGPAGEAAA
jgi:hypothetical protein